MHLVIMPISAVRTCRRWRLAHITETRSGAPWWSSATVKCWWIRHSHNLTFRSLAALHRPPVSPRHRMPATALNSTRWHDIHSSTSSHQRVVTIATVDMANTKWLTMTRGHLVFSNFLSFSIRLQLFQQASCWIQISLSLTICYCLVYLVLFAVHMTVMSAMIYMSPYSLSIPWQFSHIYANTAEDNC